MFRLSDTCVPVIMLCSVSRKHYGKAPHAVVIHRGSKCLEYRFSVTHSIMFTIQC